MNRNDLAAKILQLAHDSKGLSGNPKLVNLSFDKYIK